MRGLVDPVTGGVLRTVCGDIPAAGPGPVLFHEHLISDASAWSSDADLVCTDIEAVAEELRASASVGVAVIVDATPIDFGRDVRALADVSRRSGVPIIAGTGLYREISYPAWLDDWDEDRLTQRFVADILVGVDGGPSRAGVIGEIGSSESMTPRERRVLRAAAHAQLATGAAVVTHTQEGRGALEQLEWLLRLGVDASRIVVGHLDCAGDATLAHEVARLGANVGYDRIGLEQYVSDDARAAEVVRLIERGYAQQLLLSGDQARVSQYRANGGAGLGKVLDRFLPLLRRFGVPDETLELIMVANPRRVLALSVPQSSGERPLQPAADRSADE